MFQKLTQSLAGQHTLGYLYDLGDGHNKKASVQRLMEDAALMGLVKEVTAFQPDAIVCTHFLPAQLCASVCARSRIISSPLKLNLVVTDLDLQSMWVQKNVHRYFLPRPDSALVLHAAESVFEMDHAAAVVSGIPIMPKFAQIRKRTSRADACELFGLKSDDPRPVVVVMSSGAKQIKEVYEQCVKCQTALQLLVVMGRQADVISVLQPIAVDDRHLVKFIGFCSQMPELLCVTHLMVGKSGGLTIAENAAVGVPLVVLDPIPGQEQRNADILLEAGAAVKVNDIALLSTKVDAIFATKADGAPAAKRPKLDNTHRWPKLTAMRTAMETLAYPNSAFTVAETVIGDHKTRTSST